MYASSLVFCYNLIMGQYKSSNNKFYVEVFQLLTAASPPSSLGNATMILSMSAIVLVFAWYTFIKKKYQNSAHVVAHGYTFGSRVIPSPTTPTATTTFPTAAVADISLQQQLLQDAYRLADIGLSIWLSGSNIKPMIISFVSLLVVGFNIMKRSFHQPNGVSPQQFMLAICCAGYVGLITKVADAFMDIIFAFFQVILMVRVKTHALTEIPTDLWCSYCPILFITAAKYVLRFCPYLVMNFPLFKLMKEEL